MSTSVESIPVKCASISRRNRRSLRHRGVVSQATTGGSDDGASETKLGSNRIASSSSPMTRPTGSARCKLSTFVIAALVMAGASSVDAGEVADRVRSAGQLNCGVVSDEYDYNKDDTHGNLTALGTDICRAVTAALLGENDLGLLVAVSARKI